MLPAKPIEIKLPDPKDFDATPLSDRETIEVYERLIRHGFIGPGSDRAYCGIFR